MHDVVYKIVKWKEKKRKERTVKWSENEKKERGKMKIRCDLHLLQAIISMGIEMLQTKFDKNCLRCVASVWERFEFDAAIYLFIWMKIIWFIRCVYNNKFDSFKKHRIQYITISIPICKQANMLFSFTWIAVNDHLAIARYSTSNIQIE